MKLHEQPEAEADLRAVLSVVYDDLAEYGKAEAMAREALAMRRKLFGNEHPEVANSLNTLSTVLLNQGKLAEAETAIREALTIEMKLLGNEHSAVVDSLVAGSFNNFGWVLAAQGNLAKAEAMFSEALTMRKKLHGNEHPQVADALHNLGGVLLDQGKLAEAEPIIRETLTMQKKLNGNEHPKVAASLYTLGTVLQRQGKLTEAEPMHREALTMRKKLLGNEHPALIDSLNNLAAILKAQGKRADAESLLLEAGELVQLNQRVPAQQKSDIMANLVNFYSTSAGAAPGGGTTQKILEWKEKLIEFDKAAQEQKRGAMTNNDPQNTAPQREISPSEFFAFIDRFLAGTNDAEVARESVEFVGSLPRSVIPTCLLIGIITRQRIGDFVNAHKLVQVLNRFASGWDLPGIPTKGDERLQKIAKLRGQVDDRRLDWALLEETDLNPILDILRGLQVNATKTETEALLSLIRQYEARQEQLQKPPNK